MKEHLTLAVDSFQPRNHALEEAVEGVRQALELSVRTVVADAPLHALANNGADLAIVDAIMARTQPRPDFVIAATLRRHPARDRILSLSGALQPTLMNPFGIPNGARVRVSSLRQVGPLLSCCNAQVSLLAGRRSRPLDAVANGEVDALVLPGAEFHRIAFDHELFMAVALRHEVQLPAPGDNAFVLAANSHSPHLQRLANLNDPATERCVLAELKLLHLVGPAAPALGCLARETSDGAIHLAACLTRTDSDLRTARVTRVASVTTDPREAAHYCVNAFEEVEAV